MSIQELLTELRVPYLEAGQHKHARPGWIQLDCPNCGPHSNRYHLGYNLTGRYFNCWRCAGQFAPKVLRALGASSRLVEEYLRSADTDSIVKRERSRTSLEVPKGLGPLLRKHRRYLEGRGFDPETITSLWNVQGIGIASRLSWRLYIPIYEKNQQVSWTTRSVGDAVEQRYVSASAEQESKNHKDVIYGADFCYHSIIVVEGPTDAWAVGPGAGATFGTAFSAAQVRRLIDIPHRYVCFDSSPDAQRQATELCNQLSCFPGSTENIILDAKDPGCASKKEIRLLRKVAKL